MIAGSARSLPMTGTTIRIRGFDGHRFRDTFRSRLAEWGMAAGLFLWGIHVAVAPGLFEQRPYFHPLTRIAPQWVWATVAITFGFGRLLALARNGGWQPSAVLRAIGCIAGMGVWISLTNGALSVEWLSPASGIYFANFLLDAISTWYAAQDAASMRLAREAQGSAGGHG